MSVSARPAPFFFASFNSPIPRRCHGLQDVPDAKVWVCMQGKVMVDWTELVPPLSDAPAPAHKRRCCRSSLPPMDGFGVKLGSRTWSSLGVAASWRRLSAGGQESCGEID